MENNQAIIYISNECESSKQLIKQMDLWEMRYEVKNVNENKAYMKELQLKGVYGTPATFIPGVAQPILGFDKKKLNATIDKTNEPHHFRLSFKNY